MVQIAANLQSWLATLWPWLLAPPHLCCLSTSIIIGFWGALAGQLGLEMAAVFNICDIPYVCHSASLVRLGGDDFSKPGDDSFRSAVSCETLWKCFKSKVLRLMQQCLKMPAVPNIRSFENKMNAKCVGFIGWRDDLPHPGDDFLHLQLCATSLGIVNIGDDLPQLATT